MQYLIPFAEIAALIVGLAFAVAFVVGATLFTCALTVATAENAGAPNPPA
jgi:hypothetical protein